MGGSSGHRVTTLSGSRTPLPPGLLITGKLYSPAEIPDPALQPIRDSFRAGKGQRDQNYLGERRAACLRKKYL
jgi:hypothetical protein